MNAGEEVVVIGGGIAGLATAVALSAVGFRIRLFEAGEEPGGRARSFTDTTSGDRIDIGPHVLTSEHRNMLALLERLGTDRDVVWQQGRFIRLVDGGQSIDMRNYRFPAPFHFLPNFFRVPRLTTADVWSARRVLWRVMTFDERDVIEHDDMDAETVLRQFGVSERFIDWFWRTVGMTILNVPLGECSAGSLLRFLRMMAGRGDFHFGFPAVPLADLFVPSAVEAIRRGGGDVHLRTSARRLRVDEAGLAGVLLEDGTRIATRQCVVAVPPRALAGLLPEQTPRDDRFRSLASFEASPYISSYLWFRHRLTKERFWSRIWAPRNLNYDFYDLSNIRFGWSEGPSVIASNGIFTDASNGLDEERIIDRTLEELQEQFPQARRKNLVHAVVRRIPMAIPAPRPGFERARPDVAGSTQGLYLAGDWLRTELPASMESAVRSGFLAAEALARDKGVNLELALQLRPPQGFSGWMWRHR